MMWDKVPQVAIFNAGFVSSAKLKMMWDKVRQVAIFKAGFVYGLTWDKVPLVAIFSFVTFNQKC